VNKEIEIQDWNLRRAKVLKKKKKPLPQHYSNEYETAYEENDHDRE
jgi:hypothetical protein